MKYDRVTYRAEIVKGEGFGDIIDNSLNSNNLQNNKNIKFSSF